MIFPLKHLIRRLNLGMRKRKSWDFGDSIEVEENYTGRYGAPGEKRIAKKKLTSKEMQEKNQRNREKKMRRLIKANFKENDYWITLTYERGSRPEVDELQKDLREFIRKVRERYRKADCELKWIARMEIGSRGGPHLHVLLNRIQTECTTTDLIISACWRDGGAYPKMLYKAGGFKDLADYIVKPKQKHEPDILKRYSRSRNLKIINPKVEKMSGKEWRKDPIPPKGFYLDKSSYWEGICGFTGRLSRSYTFWKCQDKVTMKSARIIRQKAREKNGIDRTENKQCRSSWNDR